MNLLEIIRNAVTGFLEGLRADVWVEISTIEPDCTYYFGPFQSRAEAEAHQAGYIEDLENEGAKQIKATIKRCNPQVLTIAH
ncbi:MAG: DUF1816 domain-containing protein [Leptolyngbyaceae bacterium]|nr:DUF1816 domain-containing protein [Leptolyngbyaceae bacterium]